MVPPYSDRITRVPPYLSLAQYHTGLFTYGAITHYGRPFQSVVKSHAITSRLLRFRSPLLSESRLMSFPRATEMFQFTRFASHTYVFSMRYLLRGGFPHSEISGSKLICQLPEAYRRLSRLSSPIIAKASTTCS